MITATETGDFAEPLQLQDGLEDDQDEMFDVSVHAGAPTSSDSPIDAKETNHQDDVRPTAIDTTDIPQPAQDDAAASLSPSRQEPPPNALDASPAKSQTQMVVLKEGNQQKDPFMNLENDKHFAKRLGNPNFRDVRLVKVQLETANHNHRFRIETVCRFRDGRIEKRQVIRTYFQFTCFVYKFCRAHPFHVVGSLPAEDVAYTQHGCDQMLHLLWLLASGGHFTADEPMLDEFLTLDQANFNRKFRLGVWEIITLFRRPRLMPLPLNAPMDVNLLLEGGGGSAHGRLVDIMMAAKQKCGVYFHLCAHMSCQKAEAVRRADAWKRASAAARGVLIELGQYRDAMRELNESVSYQDQEVSPVLTFANPFTMLGYLTLWPWTRRDVLARERARKINPTNATIAAEDADSSTPCLSANAGNDAAQGAATHHRQSHCGIRLMRYFDRVGNIALSNADSPTDNIMTPIISGTLRAQSALCLGVADSWARAEGIVRGKGSRSKTTAPSVLSNTSMTENSQSAATAVSSVVGGEGENEAKVAITGSIIPLASIIKFDLKLNDMVDRTLKRHGKDESDRKVLKALEGDIKQATEVQTEIERAILGLQDHLDILNGHSRMLMDRMRRHVHHTMRALVEAQQFCWQGSLAVLNDLKSLIDDDPFVDDMEVDLPMYPPLFDQLEDEWGYDATGGTTRASQYFRDPATSALAARASAVAKQHLVTDATTKSNSNSPKAISNSKKKGGDGNRGEGSFEVLGAATFIGDTGGGGHGDTTRRKSGATTFADAGMMDLAAAVQFIDFDDPALDMAFSGGNVGKKQDRQTAQSRNKIGSHRNNNNSAQSSPPAATTRRSKSIPKRVAADVFDEPIEVVEERGGRRRSRSRRRDTTALSDDPFA